jgi:tetratricopeptide (TPR) repeat protein
MGYLRAAIAVRPESGHALMNLANGYKALRRFDEAIACYRKATELAPDSFACWYDLGSVLEQHRRFQEAIDAWQKALQCDPSSTQAMHNLIACCRLTHQTGKAIAWEQRQRSLLLPKIQKELPTALPTDPGQAGAQLLRRAKLYAQMGDFSKATQDLGESLRLHPSQGPRMLLACTQLYLGNEEGYRTLRTALLVRSTHLTRDKLRVAEAGLLRPLSAAELADAAKWVQAGLPTTRPTAAPSTLPATQPREQPDIDYHSDLARGMLAQGMLDFRRGDFHSAFERLNRCHDEIDQIGRTHPHESLPDLDQIAITAEFYLATCQERLSQHADALQQLADARDFLESEFGVGLCGETGYGSPDWLVLHIAAREAEATIHPHSPATAPAPQP